MSAFFTFLAIALAVAFLAYAITTTLAWALIHGAEIIERRNR